MSTDTTKPKKLNIALTDVESGQIKSIGYCPINKTLAIVFKRVLGAEYQYPGVTQEQFDAFKGADSLGTHFGQHLKQLPFEKFHPETA